MISNLPLLKKKIWKFPETQAPTPEMLKAAGGSDILARLMLRRGIDSSERAEAFLDPAKYSPSSPMEFAQMDKAIVRITKAITMKEKITVYGDYDVDGVTGTSVLLTVLKSLGANVEYYIPNRASEGYGLNLKAVSVLASKQRCKLIISCDCGISNFAEINLAKSLGVETIIVDHHSMPEILPPAVAILHPKQLPEEHPLYHLPGVGVAYKLAEALLIDNKMEEEVPKLLDFVTLGMIADMVPLVRENRYLVQIGLPVLVDSPRAGIRALLDNTVKMEGTDIVGFGLAPRINAVGRLADAGLAVNLMTVDDENKAQELALQLELENARRQELCEQIFFEADKKAREALANGEDSALALYSENWHHGVVGIVASRLVEKYHCPVFIAELEKDEGKLKGSARGVIGIDLYQILKENENLMTRWGGHQMAAGFSAEAANADVLCRALVDSCNKALAGQSKRPVLEIDLSVESSELNLELAKLLRKLGPFGMWNKKPVLTMSSLTLVNSRPLGKEGKHHRLMLRSADGINQFECVYWRSSGNLPADGEQIDLAFSPEVNVFNNSERLQLVLSDWRRSGEVESEEPADLNAADNREDKTDSESGSDTIKPSVHLETSYDGRRAQTKIKDGPAPEQTESAAEIRTAVAQVASAKEAAPLKSIKNSETPSEHAAPRTVLPEGSLMQKAPASAGSFANAGENSAANKRTVQQISFKDLRHRVNLPEIVDTAVAKLGSQVKIFAESCKLNEHSLSDRSSIGETAHLLIWQYPPSLQVFRSLIGKSQAKNVYLCGGGQAEDYNCSTFLKRLLSMARFAVNKREGQAHADKLCAGLASTKMALALGLQLLKKVNAIDWYSEDSLIFLDLLESQGESHWESMPEYRQLENTLKEISEFRNWCAEASLEAIQSELLPNSIRLGGESSVTNQDLYRTDTFSRASINERASFPSGQP